MSLHVLAIHIYHFLLKLIILFNQNFYDYVLVIILMLIKFILYVLSSKTIIIF